MTSNNKETTLLQHKFRKKGTKTLILTTQNLLYQKETISDNGSKIQQTIFHIPISEIKDVWRHVGLIASLLIIEIPPEAKSQTSKENKIYKFRMDDATCQKWADTITAIRKNL